MKYRWLPIVLAAGILPSCEKKEAVPATSSPTAERRSPSPTPIEPAGDGKPSSQAAAPEPNIPAPQQDPAPTQPDLPRAPTPAPGNQIPTAKAVEGQPGFVFSPYNDKVVDVRGLPTGTLVADPTFPASEKKHFRVP